MKIVLICLKALTTSNSLIGYSLTRQHNTVLMGGGGGKVEFTGACVLIIDVLVSYVNFLILKFVSNALCMF